MDERLRCVIIDDNLDFQIAASRRLAHHGMAVVGVASSIADWLGCVETAEPAVVLVDIDLRGERLRLGRAARSKRQTVAAPVILISTHAEKDFADMARRAPR